LLRQAARANGGEYAANAQTIGQTDCGCGAPFEQGVVLDPFAGVGTSLVVARRLGRRFVGIELSEEYCRLARAKLALWWRDDRVTLAGPAPAEQAALL